MAEKWELSAVVPRLRGKLRKKGGAEGACQSRRLAVAIGDSERDKAVVLPMQLGPEPSFQR